MNIGIIIYSQTGHTLTVAQEIQKKIEAVGHSAKIDQVTIVGDAGPGARDVQFSNVPAVDDYDAVIFGSPVQAFSLAAPTAAYLNQIPSLQDKRVACFVTKQLPFHWTGGNRAIRTMKNLCDAKGASICGTQIVVWSKSRREESTRRCVDNLVKLFPA